MTTRGRRSRATSCCRRTGRRPLGAGSTAAPSRRGSNQASAEEAALGAEHDRPSNGAGRGPRTAASSTTAPRPTPTGTRGRSGRSWSGSTGRREAGPATTRRTSTRRNRPSTGRRTTRVAPRRSAATTPSSCRPTAVAGSSCRKASMDGPLPAHYEPHESPLPNRLYGQRANPARQRNQRHEDPMNPPEWADEFPFVLTTYRLTEHHTAGGMSRTVPYLSELQPQMFVRGASRSRARPRPPSRRLGDRRDHPLRDRGPRTGHPADAPRADRRPRGRTRSVFPTTGASAGSRPAAPQTT